VCTTKYYYKLASFPCSARIIYLMRTKLCYYCEAYESLLCCTAFKWFGFQRLAAVACDHALLISLLCLLWERRAWYTNLFTRSHPESMGRNLEFFLIDPDTMHLVACVAGTKSWEGGGEKCKKEKGHPIPPPSFSNHLLTSLDDFVCCFTPFLPFIATTELVPRLLPW